MGIIKRNFANNILSTGTFDATKLTGDIPTANLSANAPATDLNPLRNDVATLALREAVNSNRIGTNLVNSFIDQFEDASGIDTTSNAVRNASEYVSAIANVDDPNTLELLFADDLTTGDFTGQEIVGERGLLKIIEGTDIGQDVVADAPFSGKGWESGGWSTSNENKGFYLRTVSGQTSPLNFGTGAYTIEGFTKTVNTGYTTAHQYVIDFASALDTNRSTIAPNGTNPQGAYSGSFLPYSTGSNFYDWNTFSTSNWYHFAYVRDTSGNHAIFINGQRKIVSSSTDSTSIDYSDSSYLGICQRHNGDNSAYIKMADLRISDVARYDPTLTTLTVPSSRFSLTSLGVSSTGNFTSTTINPADSTARTKLGLIVLYKDNAGTNTLNTDIVAQVSADNGSNYSTCTLTPRGNFDSSGTKIAIANDVAVTSGTDLKYKISFANQSDGSKEARITGVSLIY